MKASRKKSMGRTTLVVRGIEVDTVPLEEAIDIKGQLIAGQ